jgi:outer membrane protein assembly factor BamD (BamD/ComL family)
MKHLSIALAFILTMILISCGPSREKRSATIKEIETRLFSPRALSLDREAADSLLQLYSAFIKDYPSDTLTRQYIFRAATVYMNTGKGKEAVEMYDLYRTKYPLDPQSAMCLFFSAYVNENLLSNLDKAQEMYILFIEKYPRHDFADDAQLALNNLGKSPEQMVKEFELRKKADSARTADSLAKAGKKRKPVRQ